ncbi:hypothetical protein EPR50_G00239410 [Perca flavescens]|uniref:Uncharacterized protein n=2 Tax=Perca flavescens TaxID=8167 RepID=A0A484BYQ2_PERFV|nr:hypothetical protein EPR50_G00239410 [Perca flavescens]
MMRERPGLEDVAEEEDLFAAEGSTLERRGFQVPGEMEVERTVEVEGQLSVSQMEEEFAQLTFRKQVSYR